MRSRCLCSGSGWAKRCDLNCSMRLFFIHVVERCGRRLWLAGSKRNVQLNGAGMVLLRLALVQECLDLCWHFVARLKHKDVDLKAPSCLGVAGHVVTYTLWINWQRYTQVLQRGVMFTTLQVHKDGGGQLRVCFACKFCGMINPSCLPNILWKEMLKSKSSLGECGNSSQARKSRKSMWWFCFLITNWNFHPDINIGKLWPNVKSLYFSRIGGKETQTLQKTIPGPIHLLLCSRQNTVFAAFGRRKKNGSTTADAPGRPGLGGWAPTTDVSVVSNHGDRKFPSLACGTPSKWPWKWLIDWWGWSDHHLRPSWEPILQAELMAFE